MADSTNSAPAGSNGNTDGIRQLPLALLRVAIGWHFLYEGLTKLQLGDWSAAGYLSNAVGPAAEYYHSLAANASLMPWVNALNIAGLILIGVCLMLGLATRLAAFCGMALLALYYMAYPPFFARRWPDGRSLFDREQEPG